MHYPFAMEIGKTGGQLRHPKADDMFRKVARSMEVVYKILFGG